MNMEKKIKQAIGMILELQFGCRVSEKNIEVFKPRKEMNGDYTSNAALKNAKMLDTKSMELAILIADSIKGELMEFSKVEAIEPGFINFHLKDWYIYKKLDAIYNSIDKNLAKSSSLKGRKILTQDLIKSIQYIHSRTNSILKYYKKEGISLPSVEGINIKDFESDIEKQIVKFISYYPAIIKDTIEKNDFLGFAKYLEELNDSFYSYHNLILFRDLNSKRLLAVLKILEGFKAVANHSLNMLGKDTPQRM